MATVRNIMEKVDQIDFVIEEINRSSKDLDYTLVSDLLNEYREVLLDKTVK